MQEHLHLASEVFGTCYQLQAFGFLSVIKRKYSDENEYLATTENTYIAKHVGTPKEANFLSILHQIFGL
jgi:hypothetical protein